MTGTVRVQNAMLRDAARALSLAVITAGTVFALQGRLPSTPYANGHAIYEHAAQTLKRMVTRDVPAPELPSVFETEMTMSGAELMDRWKPFITEASRRFGVSEAWIRAVMRMESGGRTMLGEDLPITSSAGAMGLMQVMPGTYDEMRRQYGLGADPYDPHDNVLAGAAYLRWLYRKYGYPAMFTAYNDGPGNLENHAARGQPLPEETRAYAEGIAGILSGAHGKHSTELAKFTRPDGSPVLIDPFAVKSVRAPLPGEYADGVQSVVAIGKRRQGVRENVVTATAILRNHGSRV